MRLLRMLKIIPLNKHLFPSLVVCVQPIDIGAQSQNVYRPHNASAV